MIDQLFLLSKQLTLIGRLQNLQSRNDTPNHGIVHEIRKSRTTAIIIKS